MLDKLHGAEFKVDDLYHQLSHIGKYRKKNYRGKPTRWYRDLTRKLAKYERQEEVYSGHWLESLNKMLSRMG